MIRINIRRIILPPEYCFVFRLDVRSPASAEQPLSPLLASEIGSHQHIQVEVCQQAVRLHTKTFENKLLSIIVTAR